MNGRKQIEDTKGGERKLEQSNSQKFIPFTSAGRPPFIGRRADFLHSENSLVWNESFKNVLG
jgi:hypothetical protein